MVGSKNSSDEIRAERIKHIMNKLVIFDAAGNEIGMILQKVIEKLYVKDIFEHRNEKEKRIK